MLAEQSNDQQSITILSYFIEKDKNIYVFLGLSSTADFSQYGQTLNNSMIEFDKLTDPQKLNVEPTRIQVEKVPGNMSLSQALSHYKVQQSDHNELAVLNGMQLDQELTQGSLIKVFGK
jgi:predicted Zn-dependent protease